MKAVTVAAVAVTVVLVEAIAEIAAADATDIEVFSDFGCLCKTDRGTGPFCV